MSPRLPALTAAEVISVLKKRGFVQVRQSGSHAVFRNEQGRRTTVPIHGKMTLGRGLLHQIMKDADLTADDFR